MFRDYIKLVFSEAHIISHLDKGIPLNSLGEVARQKQQEVTSFGLFDVSSPDFNTYYPSVSPEDLTPKAEDYVYPVYRALSEVMIRRFGGVIYDFTKPGVLKASRELLKGQTVYNNHEALIGNNVGVVVDVEWQEAYKTKSGVEVPAGINARFRIDGKAHPNVARAMLADPPEIHSVSVGIGFQWEKSHTDLSDEDFYRLEGTKHVDGSLIRRVVSEIERYTEISGVPHGADPFARKINANGEIVQDKDANNRNSQFNENEKDIQAYYFSYKTDIPRTETQLAELTLSENPTKFKNPTKMKKLLTLLTAFFGENIEKLEDLTDGQLSSLKGQLELEPESGTEALRLKNTALKDDNEALADVIKTLKQEKAELKEKADKFDTQLEAFRSEVIANYEKLTGDDKDEKKINTLKAANKDVLEILNAQYVEDLEKKFPMACGKCGSTNLTRASASEQQEEEDEDNPPVNLSAEEVEKKIRAKKRAFTKYQHTTPADTDK